MQKDILEASQTYEGDTLSGSIAQNTYDSSLTGYESSLKKAKEELDDASQLLSDFEEFIGDGTIYAQGSGLITEVGFSEDEYLETAGVLISYATSDAMTVSVDVSEEDVVTMKVGDSVTLAFTAYEDETYEGIIQSITTTATSRDTATVSYPVVISIQGDTSKLYEGMTADVTFITEATDAEVIYVPRKAIVEENGKYYIYKKEQETISEFVQSEVTDTIEKKPVLRHTESEILLPLQHIEKTLTQTVLPKMERKEEEKVSLIHQQKEQINQEVVEEVLNQLEANRKVKIQNETTEQTEHIVVNQIQKTKKEIMTESQQIVENMIHRELQTNLHTISEQVYRDLEKRLLSERRRRGY